MMRTHAILFLCAVFTIALESFSQEWPHIGAIQESSAVPGLFKRLGRTDAAWGLETQGFQAGVVMSQDVYATNTPVYALITLTNVSAMGGSANHTFERAGMVSLEMILLHNGELVSPKLKVDRSMPYIGRSSGRAYILKIGEVLQDGIRLDIQYPLEAGKEYQFYARRKAFVQKEEVEVTSGTVSFMITNGEPRLASGPPVAGGQPVTASPPSAAVKRRPTGSAATTGLLAGQPVTAAAARNGTVLQNANPALAAGPSGSGGIATKSPSPLALTGSSISPGQWVLLGLPLMVLIWVIGRALGRALGPPSGK